MSIFEKFFPDITGVYMARPGAKNSYLLSVWLGVSTLITNSIILAWIWFVAPMINGVIRLSTAMVALLYLGFTGRLTSDVNHALVVIRRRRH